MTVNTTDITSGPYDGNDVTTQFGYDFRVIDKTQLIVFETDDLGVVTTLTVDVDYTVNGIGNDGGGTIDRVAGALPTDYQWYIRANYPQLQDTAFASQGGFKPSVHEAALDHVTFLIQQLSDQLNRAVKLSDSFSDGVSPTLESPIAGRGLMWNEDGDGIINSDQNFNDIVTLAAASEAAAEAAQIAAEEALDSFTDKYLGPFEIDPVLDNDGNALQEGAIYWNSNANVMYAYSLSSDTWVAWGVSPTAGSVTNVPYGGLEATTVQAAINELEDEKVSIASGQVVNKEIVPLTTIGIPQTTGTSYITSTISHSYTPKQIGNKLLIEFNFSSGLYNPDVTPITCGINSKIALDGVLSTDISGRTNLNSMPQGSSNLDVKSSKIYTITTLTPIDMELFFASSNSNVSSTAMINNQSNFPALLEITEIKA